MMGLLDGLSDPEVVARISERQRLVERVAEQMGVSLPEARAALRAFEADTSSDGHTLH